MRHLASAVLVPLLLALAAPHAIAHTGEGEATRDYRSEVTNVAGAPGLAAWVDGGDAFLVLQASRGVEVIVPGYEEPEQYLRFAPDGTVYANAAGPTWYQNQDRFGQSGVPSTVSPDAPPQWVPVSSQGIFEWHDHRIHWMSPNPPRQVDRAAGADQHVFDWQVPLIIDGRPATIEGRLFWRARPPRLLPALVGLAGLLAAGALGWRRRAPWLPAAGAPVFALGMVLVPRGLRPALPGEPSPVLMGALAGLLLGAGLGLLLAAGLVLKQRS